jgi:nitroimidazol reductase NimA-like FMN-containing flavoprotein (pyridoxamine 5'-phosphate oxidase superfamily)
MNNFIPTEKTKVNRLPKRGFYDKETIYSILDEGIVCHVGFIINDKPFVIPTAYVRVDDYIYIHGAKSNQMINAINEGSEACITVTLLDGYVLARSAFHHSMNYRSVVIFGKGKIVEDDEEKMSALKAFTEHVVKGRWDDVREPSEKEMNTTSVLKFPIEEASAKVRTGPPVDDKDDYDMNVWAGVLPVKTMFGEPIRDGQLKENVSVPGYLTNYISSKNK